MPLLRAGRLRTSSLSLRHVRDTSLLKPLVLSRSYREQPDSGLSSRRRQLITRPSRPLNAPTASRSRPPTSLAVPAPAYTPNRIRTEKEEREDKILENIPDSPSIPSKGPVRRSAKLAALHARLSLPSKVPLRSLARSLIHETAEPDPNINNSSLSSLGNDLAEYYMSEYLLCRYPRLPIAVLYAAQSAYIGVEALNNVVKEWGVEAAVEPGLEVDPGLLQFQWAPTGAHVMEGVMPTARDIKFQVHATNDGPRIEHNQDFADGSRGGAIVDGDSLGSGITSLQSAAANFFQAVLAIVSLHSGASAGYKFFSNHILSRHLDVSSLFTFTHPLKDLARLCAREAFEPPVARVISETGRLSVSPVYVVGIFSGNNMLGEGAGSSLTEARFKACLHALKSWYLYSPPGELILPSHVEGDGGKHRIYKAAHIDQGEVVV